LNSSTSGDPYRVKTIAFMVLFNGSLFLGADSLDYAQD
jgi:hypothetical protein